MKKIFISFMIIMALIITVSSQTVNANNEINFDKFSQKLNEKRFKKNTETIYAQVELSTEDYLFEKNKLEISLLSEEITLESYRIEIKELISNLKREFIDKFGESNIVYSSDYIPFVVIEINENKLMKVSNHKDVKFIEIVDPNMTISNNLDYRYITLGEPTKTSKPLHLAYETTNINEFKESNPNIDGTDVKIGVLETYKINETPYEIDNVNLKYNETYSVYDNCIADYEGNPNTSTCSEETYDYYIYLRDHMTAVGIILAGNSSGIATDATLYSVRTNSSCGSASPATTNCISTFYTGLDTLIDENVNIINMSFLVNHNADSYDSLSSMIDATIRDTKVTIVASAGNSGDRDAITKYFKDNNALTSEELEEYDNNITSVGLSNNVITVGSTDIDGKVISTFSAYLGGFSKPTLVAPGGQRTTNLEDRGNTYCEGDDNYFASRLTNNDECIYIPGINYCGIGTSFSAPIVAGGIALLMEKDSTLKYKPEKIMSIITASADLSGMKYLQENVSSDLLSVENENKDSTSLNSAGLNSKAGAGLFNLYKAGEVLERTSETNGYNSSVISAGYKVMSWKFDLISGDTLKISHFYLRNSIYEESSNTLDDSYLSNYDIRLVNLDTNTVVAESTNNSSNLEILYYTVPSSASFEIQIILRDKNDLTRSNGVPLEVIGSVTINSELGLRTYIPPSSC